MRVRILDPQLLADVCRRVLRWEQQATAAGLANVPRSVKGAYACAAWALDMSPAQFWNLCHAKTGQALNPKVFRGLYHYLPHANVSVRAMRRWEKDVDRALWTPDAERAFEAYVRWLRAEFRRYGAAWRHGDPVEHPKRRSLWRAAWSMVAQLEQQCPGAFRLIEDLVKRLALRRGWKPERRGGRAQHAPNTTPAQRQWFEEFVRSPYRYLESTEIWRFDLAYLRVVEPLLATRSTGGVELAPDELGGKLETYVRAAVKREAVLLERDPDLIRVQRRGTVARPRRTRRDTPAATTHA